LELTGEPVMVQKKETLMRPLEAPEETEKATAAQEADGGPGARELESPTAANRALGLMSIPGQQSHKKTAVAW